MFSMPPIECKTKTSEPKVRWWDVTPRRIICNHYGSIIFINSKSLLECVHVFPFHANNY